MNAVEDPPQDRTRAEWVGARIRARRRHIGINQETLAERLGMRRHHVSVWETGIHEPTEPKLQQLAKALGCQWTDFYTDELDELGELVTP